MFKFFTSVNKYRYNHNHKILQTLKAIGIAANFSSKTININTNSENKSNKFNLNIPKTNFNERFNTKEKEINMIYKVTQEFYEEQINLSDKKLWVTHDSPTLANGKPHLGIIYNKILKDSINRLKIMQGYKVHFNIGFDCHGVNIEDQVLALASKRELKDVDDLYNVQFDQPENTHKAIDNLSNNDILKIRSECRDIVTNSILQQIKYYLRSGIMFDLNSIYYTMSKSYSKLQLDIFKKMYEAGLICRDNRVIFWSAEEQRILDYNDLEEKYELSDCLVAKFPIKFYGGDSKFLEEEYSNKGKKLYLLGFISDPWKYVGVRALSINPDNNYCITEINNEYFICAYKRMPELCRRVGEKKPQVLHMARGEAFKNMLAVDPLFNREIPILLSPDVSEFYGSGINILSPSHDFVSDKISHVYNLSLEGFLDNNNYFVGCGLDFLKKTHLSDGNVKIINRLKNLNFLFASWKFENQYYINIATSERIVLRSIPSWFFKINKTTKMECFRELAFMNFFPNLNFEKNLTKNVNTNKLKYMPRKTREKSKEMEAINKREYSNIIEEMDDFQEWCISEINSWGMPIPFFQYKNSSKVLIDSEIIDYLNNLFTLHGPDIWWKWPIEKLLPDKYKNISKDLITGKENFDSWYDSSISWYTVLFNGLKENESLKKIIEGDKEIQALVQKEIVKKHLYKDQPNSDDIMNRSRNHLKELNTKLKEFAIENMNKVRSISESDSLTATEDQVDGDNNNPILTADSVRSILPNQEIISHIKQKCVSYKSHNLFPADILVEGFDQHSNWLLQSILTSYSLTSHSMFNSIKTHGHVLDSSGKKLSNSKNYLDPLDMIDGTIKKTGDRQYGYGADTVRLFLLKNDGDTSFKLFEMFLEKSKGEIKFIRKMAKICLGLLNDYNENDETQILLKFKEINLLDQMIINEFVKFYSKILDSLEKYNFKEVTEDLIKFSNEIFVEIYLDSVKHKIINLPKNSSERKIHQFVLKELFYNLMKLFTPIIPFTCEDIYSYSTHLKNKKQFSGLEQLLSLEEIMIKFNYSFNNDLNFNVENLIIIKQDINKEIQSIYNLPKYKDIERNEIEILFLNLEEENSNQYPKILLSLLKSNLNYYFGVSNVYLDSVDYYNDNPEIIKYKSIRFKRKVPYKDDIVYVDIKYALVKTKKHQCLRCLFLKNNKPSRICEHCKIEMGEELSRTFI